MSKHLVITLTDLLKQRQLTVTTAESCTGGLLAGLLTDLPGSSAWFERGFVTYSNLAKEEMLGVPEELIKKDGAVSKTVVEAMARGALVHSTASLSIAITGIAGPDGGSIAKPVGTVWFGFAFANKTLRSESFLFANQSRQEIRIHACQHALKGAIALLKDKNFK